MTDNNFDFAKFDKEWMHLCVDICRAIYNNPEVQKIKNSLQDNGFLTIQEKSKFIDVCDLTKYQMIYSKYGQADSEGYKEFSKEWEKWFQKKGVESQKQRTQRSSVDHILFGSTPDPAPFLLHLEEEIAGSSV